MARADLICRVVYIENLKEGIVANFYRGTTRWRRSASSLLSVGALEHGMIKQPAASAEEPAAAAIATILAVLFCLV
jgi:hypothetical protein